MRPIVTIAAMAASLTVGAAATAANAAAPVGPVSQINVTIGSWLDQKQIDRVDQRDLELLKGELRESVEQELGKRGLLSPAGGGRLDLVIEDAVANRPTFQEMKYYPSLSYRSFANGGAEITGTYTAPDGARTPISYQRSEYNLRWARHATTWRDAEHAFDWFAKAFVEGRADQKLSPRPTKVYRPGRESYAWGRF